jgi:hypothetical protein
MPERSELVENTQAAGFPTKLLLATAPFDRQNPAYQPVGTWVVMSHTGTESSCMYPDPNGTVES